MRWSLVALLFALTACQSQTQAENDWRTQLIDTDSGCFAQAIIDYYNPATDEWEQLIRQKSGTVNYQVYAGHYADANAELDADNFCRAECYASLAIDDVDADWHSVSIVVSREHASKTDLPLCDTTAVTYFDGWGITQLEAQKDGLAWGRMTFHEPLPDPMNVVGPEPLICDGMAIRGHVGQSHVEYTWNAGLWRWERSGEIVHYDAAEKANIVDELPAQNFPGLRGLTQQQFLFPFEVSESEWIESYVDCNGHGWEFAYQIVSEQQGTFTISRDLWSATAEVKKEIEVID